MMMVYGEFRREGSFVNPCCVLDLALTEPTIVVGGGSQLWNPNLEDLVLAVS
jgi:hypothetical protein